MQGPVTLRSDHSVTGLDQISPGTRKKVAEVLITQRFETPPVLKYLRDQDSSLRGREKDKEAFRLLAPKGKVLIDDRPVFRWEALPGATAYQVSILDLNGYEVASSSVLSGSTTQWRSVKSLPRGQVFSWIVVAKIGDIDVASPSASAPEVRFAILSAKDLQVLVKLKTVRSQLALGVFYANAGLIKEAESSFQKLIEKNPQSTLPAKFLRGVRSLH